MEGVAQTPTMKQNEVIGHRKNTSKVDHLRIRAAVLMNMRSSPGLQVGGASGRM
jgi:hypothetical protein